MKYYPFQCHRPGQAAKGVTQTAQKVNPKWLIDCGPGIGVEAFDFASAFPQIKIVGLEPSQCFHKIKDYYPGELLNKAVWSEPCTKRFYKPDTELHGTFRSHEQANDWIDVECVTIDSVVKEYDIEQAFLWMDIEGAELQALEGARESLVSGIIVGVSAEVYALESAPEAEMVTLEKDVNAIMDGYGFKYVTEHCREKARRDNVYLKEDFCD